MRLLVLLMLVAVAACTPTGSAATDDPDSLDVVATVYPLAWIAEAVAPDASVTSLALRGQDPHDMELSPQQRQLIETADVVVYVGDVGFQPQIEQALGTAGARTVSAAEVVGDAALLPLESDPHDEEHAEDLEQDDHGDVDPHLWFDAGLMVQVTRAVGEAYAEVDPDKATTYLANADAVATDLERLAVDVADLLADCRHDEVIVSHEAYAYLVTPHDIVQHGISGAAGHSAASPRDIADLSAEVREQGIPAVLSEPVEGRNDAEAIAAEAGVDIIDIYSLDIVDAETARRGFPTLLREQAQAVAQAAECR